MDEICNDPACRHVARVHTPQDGCLAVLPGGDLCPCGRSPAEVLLAARRGASGE